MLNCIGAFLVLVDSAVFAIDISDVEKLSGCYLVDYSYSETKVLEEDYVLDSRVYDVKKMVVKEWIKVVDRAADTVRLQHFMQADSLSGKTAFMMRHHAEIWQKNPLYRYRYLGNFDGQDRWDVEDLSENENHWVRQITHLDDGLRYQCLGQWKGSHHFPRFECDAFSLIPGRETRDMGRKDYNTLDRKSAVTMYPSSWLERQNNTKIKFTSALSTPLVEEAGKIWSVKIPDEECENVQKWAESREDFWSVLAEVWKEVYDERRPFHENKIVDGSTRGSKISKLQKEYGAVVGSDPDKAEYVRLELKRIIQSHRD